MVADERETCGWAQLVGLLGAAALWGIALMAGFLALAGCAPGPHVDTAPPPPVVVTSDREVTVACVRETDIPVPPAMVGPALTGDAVRDALLLTAARERDLAWQGTALALLKGCEIGRP